jgi:hypothetical protein
MFALRTAKIMVARVGAAHVRRASSLVSGVNAAVSSLPMREAVRYSAGNVKVTADELNKFAESHANALAEYGFKKGDTIALWMKESMEKHVTLLASAKMGMQVVELDESINTKEDVRSALGMAQPMTVMFDPITDSADRLLLLRQAIPELFDYDDTMGQPFHSKYFPSIKYFIHTGFDIEIGCLNYKGCFLPDAAVNYCDAASAALDDTTPLYAHISKGSDGLTASKVATHKDALGLPSFAFAKNLTDKKYFEL